MANHIKPFATSPDASVMTDEELAVAPELQRGFIPKSKADSRLIGKLIQNATAGSYVIGEFITQNGGSEVSGSDANTMYTSYDQAMKAFIKSNTPAPDLKPYLTVAEADNRENALRESIEDKMDRSEAEYTFETKYNVTSKITEATTQLTEKINGKADVAHTHEIANVNGLQAGLDAKATTTWVTGELAKKANTASPTFTGIVTATTFKGDLTGNVTGNVTGNATTATKATQDGTGKVIAETYATKDEVNGKAPLDHDHTIAEITDLQKNLDLKVNTTTYTEDKKTFATKGEVAAKVDTTTYTQEKAGFATKTELAGYVTKSNADSTYETKANVATLTGRVSAAESKFNNYYTKQQVDQQVSKVYRYKGSVATRANLPSSDRVAGDVYNLEDTGMNVAWDGAKWDDLGGAVDLSGYLSKKEAGSTYATKSEMTNSLGGKADKTHTHSEGDITGLTAKLGTLATKVDVNAKADSTYVDQQLATKAPTANPTFTGIVTAPTFKGALTGNAATATKATQDASGNVIVDTYATKEFVTTEIDKVQTGSGFVTLTTMNTALDKKVDKTAYEADKATFATKKELTDKAATLMGKAGGAFTGAVTVQTPTADMHPATKKYVDTKVSAVYRYKGSVANEAALPKSNQVVGDVYNLEDTGSNVAWDGKAWDKLGGATDLSAYATTAKMNEALAKKVELTTYNADKSTFALKSELTTKLAAKLDVSAAFTQTQADVLYLSKTGKATSAANADTATKALQDNNGRPIVETYVTKEDLLNGGYLEASPFGAQRDRTSGKPNYGLDSIDITGVMETVDYGSPRDRDPSKPNYGLQ